MKHSQVPTVQQSIARGLCPSLAEELVLINPDSLPTRIPDFRHPQSKTVDFSGNVPGFLRPLVRQAARALSPKPVVDPQQCIGCGRCSRELPVPGHPHRAGQGPHPLQALHPLLLRHEMCPVKAIHIRGRV